MSKALRFLQITARHQDFPFLTVFSIIKTFSKISRPYWRKKGPVNDFVRFPVPRITAEVKLVIGSFRCYDNSDVIAALMMTNCHLNTTVVAIFPNVCLPRCSLCSDLVLTLENCIEPPSYARTAYVVVIWPSFLFDSFVKIWATCQIFLGKWFTALPGKKFPVRLCLLIRSL